MDGLAVDLKTALDESSSLSGRQCHRLSTRPRALHQQQRALACRRIGGDVEGDTTSSSTAAKVHNLDRIRIQTRRHRRKCRCQPPVGVLADQRHSYIDSQISAMPAVDGTFAGDEVEEAADSPMTDDMVPNFPIPTAVATSGVDVSKQYLIPASDSSLSSFGCEMKRSKGNPSCNATFIATAPIGRPMSSHPGPDVHFCHQCKSAHLQDTGLVIPDPSGLEVADLRPRLTSCKRKRTKKAISVVSGRCCANVQCLAGKRISGVTSSSQSSECDFKSSVRESSSMSNGSWIMLSERCQRWPSGTTAMERLVQNFMPVDMDNHVDADDEQSDWQDE